MSEFKRTPVAVVGAGGAVGREAIGILLERGHDPASIVAFGSERSAGRVLEFGAHRVQIDAYAPEHAARCPGALLCTSAQVSAQIAPELVENGVCVVDNSSHFRMHPDVPLVVPEINGHLLSTDPPPRLIANPNCSTIMLLTALDPIRRAYGIESLVVSTYQAVSGAGAPAIEELFAETTRALAGEESAPAVFPVSCAFNVFPHESSRDAAGYCGEERKMIDESRRIWDDPTLDLLPTCVRVPVERAHAQSIVITTATPTTAPALTEALRQSPGVRLHPGYDLSPRAAAHCDDVHVAPIRASEADSGRRFTLWICCDQLRRGAALNAIECLRLRMAHALTSVGQR